MQGRCWWGEGGHRVHRAERCGGAAIAWPSGYTGAFHSNSGGGETECIGPRGLGESDHSPETVV